MKNKIFVKHDGGKIEIPGSVLSHLLEFRQCLPHMHEAGGVLLGRHIIEVSDIVIDHFTIPSKGDRSTRTSFQRRSKLHQKLIEEYWHNSNNTCNYLGEWHTHPEKVPFPSSIDIANWKNIIESTIYDNYNLFFLIIGTRTINFWEGIVSDKIFVQLKEFK